MKSYFLTFLLCSAVMLNAQTNAKLVNAMDPVPSFKEGTQIITLGYGFPNWLAIPAFADRNYVPSKNIGPLHFKWEYGLSNYIGFAVGVNYSSVTITNFNNNYNFPYPPSSSSYEIHDYTATSILARLNFHFGITDKLDPYFGLGTGYRASSDVEHYTTGSSSTTYYGRIPIGFETTIGARYYVANSTAIYLEMGIAQSFMQFGLTLKF